jgi:ATP-dependent RNA helicase RhlE
VHRIGRTGRAGANGEAISLVSPEEGGLLRQIQRMLKAEIVMETVSGYAPGKPIRLDAPIPKNGGGNARPGGQRPPRKPAHRAHGKPQDRGAHAHAGTPQRNDGQGRRRRGGRNSRA